jgi:hypothetical protein
MDPNEEIWWYDWGGIPKKIPDNIESLSDEEVKSLVQEWKGKVRNENEQSGKQKLANIKPLPNVSMEVPKWLMDRTKEAASLYVNGYWLASIGLCGSIGEYVTWRILQNTITKKGIGVLVKSRKGVQRQSDRIKLLHKATLISDDQAKWLKIISETRNTWLHLGQIGPQEEVKKNAFEVLTKVIEVLNVIYPIKSVMRPSV